jgi:exocyst complex component 8
MMPFLTVRYSYEEFIMISKEISTLENDMSELKESLAEWKSMPSLLRIEEAGQAQGGNRPLALPKPRPNVKLA